MISARWLIGWLALALPLAGSAKDHDDETVWSASGQWVVDDAGEACTLSRAFALGKSELLFSYRPWLAFRGADVAFVSTDSKLLRHPRGTVTLLPGGRVVASDTAPFKLKEGSALTFAISDPNSLEVLSDAAEVRISFGEGPTFRLSLGPMVKAIAALRVCDEGVIRRLGHERADLVKVTADQARPVFTGDVYPADALRAHVGGRVIAIVRFDRAGTPAECKVARTSGVSSLDGTSCDRIMERLRIDPATDGSERRWTIYPVNWQLP